MKAQIKILAEWEKNKPLQQAFVKNKEFDNEKELAEYCKWVMDEFCRIHESKIFMKVECTIDPIKYDNGIELLPE